MRGCTSSLLPVVEPRETTKQTDKNWETSLTTAVLQPKTRRCGNKKSCLICPHNKRFGAEHRTHECHKTILTTTELHTINKRIAEAPDTLRTRSNEPQKAKTQTRTRIDHHFQDPPSGVRATWYCTNKWHTNETQVHKKNPRRDGNAQKACSTTNILSKMLCLRPKPRSGQLAINSAQT